MALLHKVHPLKSYVNFVGIKLVKANKKSKNSSASVMAIGHNYLPQLWRTKNYLSSWICEPLTTYFSKDKVTLCKKWMTSITYSWRYRRLERLQWTQFQLNIQHKNQYSYNIQYGRFQSVFFNKVWLFRTFKIISKQVWRHWPLNPLPDPRFLANQHRRESEPRCGRWGGQACPDGKTRTRMKHPRRRQSPWLRWRPKIGK